MYKRIVHVSVCQSKHRRVAISKFTPDKADGRMNGSNRCELRDLHFGLQHLRSLGAHRCWPALAKKLHALEGRGLARAELP